MNEADPDDIGDTPARPEVVLESAAWSGTAPASADRLAGSHPRSWLPLVMAGVVIAVIATLLVWSWLSRDWSDSDPQGFRGGMAEQSRPVA